MITTKENHKAWLEKSFHIAVNECVPGTTLPQVLPASAPKGRNIVLGAGKAAEESG